MSSDSHEGTEDSDDDIPISKWIHFSADEETSGHSSSSREDLSDDASTEGSSLSIRHYAKTYLSKLRAEAEFVDIETISERDDDHSNNIYNEERELLMDSTSTKSRAICVGGPYESGKFCEENVSGRLSGGSSQNELEIDNGNTEMFGEVDKTVQNGEGNSRKEDGRDVSSLPMEISAEPNLLKRELEPHAQSQGTPHAVPSSSHAHDIDIDSHTGAASASLVTIGDLELPAEYVPLYRLIYERYGHIATNEVIKYCRPVIVCGVVTVLEVVSSMMKRKESDVSKELLDSWDALIRDVESIKFNVGWFRSRFGEIQNQWKVRERVLKHEKALEILQKRRDELCTSLDSVEEEISAHQTALESEKNRLCNVSIIG